LLNTAHTILVVTLSLPISFSDAHTSHETTLVTTAVTNMWQFLDSHSSEYQNRLTHTMSPRSWFLLNKRSAVAEMGDHLATADKGQKVGLLCSFPCGSLVPT